MIQKRDQDAIQRTWSKEFFQYWFDQIQFIPLVIQKSVLPAMVEGLSLSVHGFFSYEGEKSLPITSYEHQMNVVQSKMKTGDIDGAKKLFELTSSAVLHHKLLIDNFADLGLSSKVDQKIRNWASALGMLYRAQSQ